MGKTSKPLNILVSNDMMGWPEVQELISKGHNVQKVDQWRVKNAQGVYSEQPYDFFDLIIGPKVWRMNESLRHYLSDTVRAARLEKYGRKETDDE